MTDKLREALERIKALDVPVNIVDVMDSTAREAVEIAKAALAQHSVYQLPDDLYPDSKCWVDGTYAERVEWLHTMYESSKQTLNVLLGQQDAQAVPQGWIPPSGLKVADIGFRWDSDALQHVPHVLVEFEPVPANLPNTEKGWADRDAFVEMLNAAPTPPAQRVMLTDDEIEDLARGKSGHSDFARDIIEAYERKNGIK